MPKYSLLWVCLFLAWVAVCQVTWIHILPQHLMMWFFLKDWYIWKAEGDKDPPFLTHVPSACRCRGQAGTGDQEPGASTWGQNWSALPFILCSQDELGLTAGALGWDEDRLSGSSTCCPTSPGPTLSNFDNFFFTQNVIFLTQNVKKAK